MINVSTTILTPEIQTLLPRLFNKARI